MGKVCDGVTDCIGSEDEKGCPLQIRCLVMEEVCDGVIQCHLYDDDEKVCLVPDCLTLCTYKLNSLQCSAWHISLLPFFNASNNITSSWINKISILSLQRLGLSNIKVYVTKSPQLKYLDVYLTILPFQLLHRE